jgi:hypothetical protein
MKSASGKGDVIAGTFGCGVSTLHPSGTQVPFTSVQSTESWLASAGSVREQGWGGDVFRAVGWGLGNETARVISGSAGEFRKNTALHWTHQ